MPSPASVARDGEFHRRLALLGRIDAVMPIAAAAPCAIADRIDP